MANICAFICDLLRPNNEIFVDQFSGLKIRQLLSSVCSFDIAVCIRSPIFKKKLQNGVMKCIYYASCLVSHTAKHFYVPNFEEVEGAYWFGSVCAVSE